MKSKVNENFIGISIVATPIGNLKDISERAIQTISEADIIICENPKHSLKLLNNLGIKKKLISLHDYNENKVIERITNKLLDKKIVLISDAGSPLISDPGFNLIKHCIKNNIKITSIPGPSSIIPALQLSGIPINEFYFAGFFPKNYGDGSKFINQINNINKTSVFFVSNHKIKMCLEILENILKNRIISIAKELTKINENVFRGTVQGVKQNFVDMEGEIKGEYVVIVTPVNQKKTVSDNLETHEKEVSLMLSKFSLTDVVEIVHKLTGITKNTVYKWVLNLKK